MRISAAYGSVGIGTSTFTASNPEMLKINAGITGNSNFQNLIVAIGNTNSYAQVNVNNQNSGTSASTDFIATADNGDNSDYYTDMGINSSTYNVPTFSVSGPNDGYLYVQGISDGSASGGNLVLGTANAAKNIEFFTGGTLATNERMTINGVGQVKISDLGNVLADPNSLLEIESNNKGILIPRVVNYQYCNSISSVSECNSS